MPSWRYFYFGFNFFIRNNVKKVIANLYRCTNAAAAKSLQSCPTLCDSIDGSPPGSPVPGILQARTVEWVAISFSNSWKMKVKSESEVAQSCPTLSDPWTVAHQAPPSMGFSRQEYWSGSPLIKGLHCVYTVLLYDLAQVIQSKLGMKLILYFKWPKEHNRNLLNKWYLSFIGHTMQSFS